MSSGQSQITRRGDLQLFAKYSYKLGTKQKLPSLAICDPLYYLYLFCD